MELVVEKSKHNNFWLTMILETHTQERYFFVFHKKINTTLVSQIFLKE